MRAAVCSAVERNAVAIAQMMMAADGHAIAQPAKPQRGFEIGHALVTVGGIVAAAANRRRRFAARGPMCLTP